MAAKKQNNQLGSWAFTIGVIVAIVLGLVGAKLTNNWQGILAIVLIVIGIIVGVLNVTGEEAMGFLTTSAILVFVSFAGAQTLVAASNVWVLKALVDVFQSLMILFVPATIVVAIKTVFTLARD